MTYFSSTESRCALIEIDMRVYRNSRFSYSYVTLSCSVKLVRTDCILVIRPWNRANWFGRTYLERDRVIVSAVEPDDEAD